MTNGIVKLEQQDLAKPADTQREYVAGGSSFYQNGARSLPWAIDDITQDLGDDVYDRMLMDPQVAASVNVFKAAILEDGVNLVPPVTDMDADGYDLAVEIDAFCEHALDEMPSEISFDDTLWDLASGIALGNRVAEQTYHVDRTFSGKQQLTLASVKVKPRRSTAFVVDTWYNVLGLLGAQPGQGQAARAGTVLFDPTHEIDLLPRSKFAVYTFRPKDNDPRGTSILRPAYNAWWLKMQTWVEYLKYLAQFASPMLIGITADKAKGVGGKSPEDLMLEMLIQARNGTAIAAIFGSKIEYMQSQGNGEAFHAAFALYGREIVTAILNQTRATMEAENGSKADSETSQDVLDTLVRQGKKSVQRMVRRDILRYTVLYNYGEKALALTPKVTLGQTEAQDWHKIAGSVATLWSSKYLDASQRPGLDLLMNLPPRMAPEPGDEPPADEQQQDQQKQEEGQE